MTRGEHAVVTGGAGFVGSHLVDRLLEDGFRVTSIDNYGSGRRENLEHLSDEAGFTELEHDIREPLPEFKNVDQIYHFASRASPADFKSHAIEIAQTNSQGTRNVYDLAIEHYAQLVIASTSEIYGDPEVHPQSEEYSGNVNVRGPRAPYDESKRFAEALAVAYAQRYEFDARILRIFNTYGPRMRNDDGRVIPNFLSQAIQGKDLTVYGDGTQTRSFCYVDDLVEGIRRIGGAESERVANTVFNIGHTHEITINTLAETVLDTVDTSSEIVHIDRPTEDPDYRQPNIDRIQSTLDWEPTVDLHTGLDRTISYFERELGAMTPDS
ncbi:NAD-dependent epimerase/dehydratase family protein [Halobacteriaceae archaeon SHR40]|uniref:NAD-dependent epimerase/dehydratase family protein n=1 Tax=Halovenus amylolytica TaxID=2500550 RepID=UPI000FE36782